MKTEGVSGKDHILMDTEPPTVTHEFIPAYHGLTVKEFRDVKIGDLLPNGTHVLDKYTHGQFDDPNAAVQIYLSDGNTVNGIGSTTLTVYVS